MYTQHTPYTPCTRQHSHIPQPLYTPTYTLPTPHTQSGSEKGQGSHLNRIIQLTGFSDPVYAEAYVTVHQYDIVLDVMVINRTQQTMQNLCLELATMGDLKVWWCGVGLGVLCARGCCGQGGVAGKGLLCVRGCVLTMHMYNRFTRDADDVQ